MIGRSQYDAGDFINEPPPKTPYAHGTRDVVHGGSGDMFSLMESEELHLQIDQWMMNHLT